MAGIFEKAGFSRSQRLIIFLSICIPIRLGFVYSARLFHEKNIFKILVLFAALFSIYTNTNSLIKNGVNDVVWSRKTHILSSVLLLFSILTGNSSFLQYILLWDVCSGALQYIMFR